MQVTLPKNVVYGENIPVQVSQKSTKQIGTLKNLQVSWKQQKPSKDLKEDAEVSV